MIRLLVILAFLSWHYGHAQGIGVLSLPDNTIQSLEGGTSVAPSNDRWRPFYLGANPAVLGDSSSLWVPQVSAHLMYNGIRFFSASGGFMLAGQHVGVMIRSLSAGDMQGYDASGIATAMFNPRNHSIHLLWGRKIVPFSLGVDVSYAEEHLGPYIDRAMLLSGGVLFEGIKNQFTAGLVIRNMGFMFSNYNSQYPQLPFNVSIGASLKPEYMPFRFYFNFTDLYQWDIRYQDNVIPPENFVGEIFDALSAGLYHFRVGIEVPLGKHLFFKSSYNHRIRNELRVGDIAGLSGFSFGGILDTKYIQASYGVVHYHLSGATHQLTFSYKIKRY